MTMRCFATIAYVHKLNRILYIFVNVGKVIGFIACLSTSLLTPPL